MEVLEGRYVNTTSPGRKENKFPQPWLKLATPSTNMIRTIQIAEFANSLFFHN